MKWFTLLLFARLGRGICRLPRLLQRGDAGAQQQPSATTSAG